jgi:hypothetical protein
MDQSAITQTENLMMTARLKAIAVSGVCPSLLLTNTLDFFRLFTAMNSPPTLFRLVDSSSVGSPIGQRPFLRRAGVTLSTHL